MKRISPGSPQVPFGITLLLAAALVVGCQEQANPVAPEIEYTELSDTAIGLSKGPDCDKHPNHPNCNGGGDEGGTDCQFSVDLTINTATSLETSPATRVRADVHLDSPVYYSGKDKVSAGTGSGPGFRFDTNGSQQVDHSKDIRRVKLDLSGLDLDGDGDPEGLVTTGVDFRFDKGLGGLDLCSLNPNESGEVPANMSFELPDGSTKALSWGCRATHDSDQLLGTPLTVIRLGDVNGKRQWKMEGNTACLRDGGGFGPIIDPSQEIPVSFSITEQ